MTSNINPYWDEHDEIIQNIAEHPGAVLKMYLAERHIPAAKVADYLGVARPGFANMLNAKRAITAPLAIKIEDAIGYPSELLMTLMANHELAVAKASATHIQRMPELA
jgi:HTH-type transcriptional regulator/antitoxin HigA